MSSSPRSNVFVGCKQSFKVEASKSLFAIGGGWGRGVLGGELWEMRKWRTGTNSCETEHLCVCVFFSVMHRNNLSDFIYICFNISKI